MQVIRYPVECRLVDTSVPTVAKVDVKAVRRLGSAPWMRIIQSEPPFAAAAQVHQLGNIADIFFGVAPYRVGRGKPHQTHRDLALRPFTFHRFRKGTVPVARSRDLSPFRVGPISEFIQFGPWLAGPGRNLDLAHNPRVFVREICGRDGSLVAAVPPLGTVARYGVFTIVCEQIAPDILCALLNSEAIAYFVRSHCAGYHKESFGRITARDLRNLPVPETLLQREQGNKQRALRKKLAKAASHAVSAAAAKNEIGLTRATAKINLFIDSAFGWNTVKASSGPTLKQPSDDNVRSFSTDSALGLLSGGS